MKKVFFILLFACSIMVFGSNKVSGKITDNGNKTEQMDLNDRSGILLLKMNSDEFFYYSVKKILDRKEAPKDGDKNLNSSDFLQAFLQKAEEKGTKRLDSCIAKDINGKIFAKDYYYYYPYGTYPAGALKSNEMWTLDEETNEWHGYRMSATYDEFGNANNRLVEITQDGKWIPEARYTATYTAREGELLLDMVEIYENGEWTGDSKRMAAFDAQGRKTLVTSYLWDNGLKDWVNGEKAEYIYENDKSTELGYTWGEDAWLKVSRLETTMDQNGNVTIMENCQWDNEKNDWRIDMRVENTYDSEGNLTLMTNYGYYEKTGELLPNGKEVYSYDTNTKTVESFGFNYDTNEWDGISKTQEKYENDLVVENYTYTWVSDAKSWTNETKGVHEYNQDGKPVLSVNYVWDGTEWQYNTKAEIEYNQYGYEIHNVGYMYDAGNKTWIKNSELIAEIDSEGRTLKMEPYMLDEEGNWIGAGPKEVYELDENGKSVRDEFSFWNVETGEWEIDEIADYYYTLVSSGIGDTKKDAKAVVVSAAEGKILIDNTGNERIDIYAANGLLVYKTAAAGNNVVVPMDRGFYIVRVGGDSFKVNVR